MTGSGVSPGVLGALAGFAGALIMLGIPIAGFLRRLDRHVQKSLRLLTGDEEIEGDGVLDRLQGVEKRSVENRVALREHDGIEVPDLGEEIDARTDGGTHSEADL